MQTNCDVVNCLAAAAKSLSDLNNYPFSERRHVWAERLHVNAPELQVLQNLPDLGRDRYQVCPGNVFPAIGDAPQGSAGIAEIARTVRANPGNIVQPALEALSAAHACSGLNAFIELCGEAELVEQSQAAKTSFQENNPSPLLGVPVAIKDLMAVRGFALTGGTRRVSHAPSTVDATAVKRLRHAGALFVGTTNLHELAYGITSENPHYGTVGNPLAKGHMSGGSSGGSAAAVAAGIVRASVGTDTAGSIRIPAACCGIVGFKPTFDAISRQGAFNLGPSLDHLGPMTRSVDDAALMFAVMAGMTPRAASMPSTLSGIRIGVPANYFFDNLSSPVNSAVRAALGQMQSDGAELIDIDLPGIENCAALQFGTLCSEATDVHWQRLIKQPDSMGEDVRVRLEIGQLLPAFWYARVQRARTHIAGLFDSAMSRVDVLVTPTLRVTAPPTGSASVSTNQGSVPLHTALTGLTMPFNLTGMPALTLPCGIDADGLSVGLQLVAARNHDWKLLSVSSRVEVLLGRLLTAGTVQQIY